MDNVNYIMKSLELHLFFGRIMKEHSLFLEAGFTPADASFAQKAEFYKKEFDKLLDQAVRMSDGLIRPEILDSGEIVTEFTLVVERQTEHLTGISIDQRITERELRLRCGNRRCRDDSVRCRQVHQLNCRAFDLVNGLITFKERILKNVLQCRMFTLNYPLLIEHIIREAKLYRQYIQMLERTGDLADDSMKEIECFWNRIMMEHALFIRGLLDPSEEELISTADGFAKDFAKLLGACDRAQSCAQTEASLEAALKIRDFKRAGTQGIAQCRIRSIILPLLVDHVLREANHYIRLLE